MKHLIVSFAMVFGLVGAAVAADSLPVNLWGGITVAIPGQFDNVDAFTNVITGTSDVGLSTDLLQWKCLKLGAGAVVSDPDKGAPYGKVGAELGALNIPSVKGLEDVKVSIVGGYNFKDSNYVLGFSLSKGFTIGK